MWSPSTRTWPPALGAPSRVWSRSPRRAVLVLVPTELESGLLFPDGPPAPLAVCGFGLAAAGAGAAHAIAEHRDAAAGGVILVGAAGTYDGAAHPVGSAGRVRAVRAGRRGAGCGVG